VTIDRTMIVSMPNASNGAIKANGAYSAASDTTSPISFR